MRHHHQEPFAYPQAILKRTAIIKVEIEEMMGKAYGTDLSSFSNNIHKCTGVQNTTLALLEKNRLL
jgi:hypothetical protein